jgi:hypothetical protein
MSQEAALKRVGAGQPESRKVVTITGGKYSGQFRTKENDIYFIKLDRL